MNKGFSIAFFGSSLVSSYWNGAATYYRGLIRALHGLGHRVTFFEPDAFDRQQHRDMEAPPWAEVAVYPATEEGVFRSLEAARGADIVVKASGVGVFDELLEKEVLSLKNVHNRVVFWDVDAPATLERIAGNPSDPFRPLIPAYDLILTYGGGDPVVAGYSALGARECIPIYNALDPDTHHPAPSNHNFCADLAFLGNRLPDREKRVEEFFFKAADMLPNKKFLLAGSGWEDKERPENVAYLGHLGTAHHNAFNCSPLAVLNISRDSMAKNGFSPATRVFEAAGAGTCIVTDNWQGVEQFFEPGKEILVADSGEQVAHILERLTVKEASIIGLHAFARARAEHTYAHRAREVEAIFMEETVNVHSFAGGAA
ncbi:glycosyltransferase [Geotalea sp. SG265]|uniref:CgeB family protein n=1 Tax=Geotalea sp. SG265 TaxID=2922867 RepID=UPI001FAEE9EC|nr:glycosyltransferase [Geotalea sp. SG265]